MSVVVEVHDAAKYFYNTGSDILLAKMRRKVWDNESTISVYPQLLKISLLKNDATACRRILEAACYFGRNANGVYEKLGRRAKESAEVIFMALECDKKAGEYIIKHLDWLSVMSNTPMGDVALRVIQATRGLGGERDRMLQLLVDHDPNSTEKIWKDRRFVKRVGEIVSLKPARKLVMEVFSKDEEVMRSCSVKWGPSIIDIEPGNFGLLRRVVVHHPSAMLHSTFRDNQAAVIECLKVNSYTLRFADDSVLVPIVYIKRLLSRTQFSFVIAAYFELDAALAFILANFFAREHLKCLV